MAKQQRILHQGLRGGEHSETEANVKRTWGGQRCESVDAQADGCEGATVWS